MESKKINTLIVLMCIMIVLIGVLGYFVFRLYNTKNQNDSIPTVSDNKIEVQTEDKEEIGKVDVTFEEEEYLTEKEKGLVVARNTRNIPTVTIKGKDSIANKITKSLNAISDKVWENIRATSDDMLEQQEIGLGVNYKMSVEKITEDTLTIKATTDGSFGGVSWDSVALYCYNLTTGELYTLDTISKNNEAFVKLIKDKIIENVKSNNIEVNENYEDELDEVLKTQTTFGFCNKGLEIILEKYSIASGSEGTISVILAETEYSSYITLK